MNYLPKILAGLCVAIAFVISSANAATVTKSQPTKAYCKTFYSMDTEKVPKACLGKIPNEEWIIKETIIILERENPSILEYYMRALNSGNWKVALEVEKATAERFPNYFEHY